MFIMKRRLNLGILVKFDSAFPDAYCHFKIFDRLEKGPIGTMPQQKAQFQLELCHNRRAPFQLELCHNRRHHFNWNYATTKGTISIGTMLQQKAPFQARYKCLPVYLLLENGARLKSKYKIRIKTNTHTFSATQIRSSD